jgi:hypothetical protein
LYKGAEKRGFGNYGLVTVSRLVGSNLKDSWRKTGFSASCGFRFRKCVFAGTDISKSTERRLAGLLLKRVPSPYNELDWSAAAY